MNTLFLKKSSIQTLFLSHSNYRYKIKFVPFIGLIIYYHCRKNARKEFQSRSCRAIIEYPFLKVIISMLVSAPIKDVNDNFKGAKKSFQISEYNWASFGTQAPAKFLFWREIVLVSKPCRTGWKGSRTLLMARKARLFRKFVIVVMLLNAMVFDPTIAIYLGELYFIYFYIYIVFWPYYIVNEKTLHQTWFIIKIFEICN